MCLPGHSSVIICCCGVRDLGLWASVMMTLVDETNRGNALWSPQCRQVTSKPSRTVFSFCALLGKGDSLSYTEWQEIGCKADAKHIKWKSHGGQWAGQMHPLRMRPSHCKLNQMGVLLSCGKHEIFCCKLQLYLVYRNNLGLHTSLYWTCQKQCEVKVRRCGSTLPDAN